LRALSRRVSSVSNVADAASVMNQESAKRFRVAVFTTPLTVLGSPVTKAVKWSSPMPSSTYKVDAGCSIDNTALSYTITNQTAEGCTVTFNAPVLLAAGTVVIVLAISPAPAS
jgi:hypothetical protein